VTGASTGLDTRSGDEPEAAARGWVERHGRPRSEALFVLAGGVLGITSLDGAEAPWWVDLVSVTAADAIGDVVDGVEQVEFFLEDGTTFRAAWDDAFTAPVVAALQAATAAPPEPPPVPVAATEVLPGEPPPPAASPGPPRFTPTPTPDASAPEDGQATPPPAPPSPEPPSPEPPSPEAPSRGPSSAPPAAGAALVLEDVAYLGGYPGEARRRKRCVATLTREGIEVTGPHELSLRVSWEVVRTVEAQNADEARFRMNTKIHRDATALVVDCAQDVTIVLEARDCPTIPLRSAINSLVADLRVVVV
jgi:hypothetical protein